MIASIDSLTNASKTSTTSAASEKSDSLGKEDFLNLLVAQLKYQDPLEPQDNTEAVAQLAQYSELEAMLAVKEEMTALSESVTGAIPELNNSVQYSTGLYLLNSNVRIEQDSVTWYGDTDEPVTVNVNAKALSTVDVNILDKDENVVATLTATADKNGVATVTWDGRDEEGNLASLGKYGVQIEGSASDSSLYSFVEGVVEGACSQDNTAMVRIDGKLYPVSKIVDVSITE